MNLVDVFVLDDWLQYSQKLFVRNLSHVSPKNSIASIAELFAVDPFKEEFWDCQIGDRHNFDSVAKHFFKSANIELPLHYKLKKKLFSIKYELENHVGSMLDNSDVEISFLNDIYLSLASAPQPKRDDTKSTQIGIVSAWLQKSLGMFVKSYTHHHVKKSKIDILAISPLENELWICQIGTKDHFDSAIQVLTDTDIEQTTKEFVPSLYTVKKKLLVVQSEFESYGPDNFPNAEIEILYLHNLINDEIEDIKQNLSDYPAGCLGILDEQSRMYQ